MKLLSCHIFGFGKISDRKFVFNDGVNTVLEQNGFGKTTLADFMKVMFYGFDDESKRSLKDKEREKYRPWDKGTYGGSIAFEYEGKSYEVSRTFGKNEGEDSFDVRTLPDNDKYDGFEKDNLGLKIFGIDKDSFYRTAYIASSDLNRNSEIIGDSVRAKLGNLTDATDDINNFDKVKSKLEKKLNEYSPDRKPGKIKSLKAEIAENENKIRNIDMTDKGIEILESQIQKNIEKTENEKNKIKALKEEEKTIHEVESIKAKRETYDSLINEHKASVESAKEASEVFTNRIPQAEEITLSKEKCIKMNHLVEEMSNNRFHKDERWNELSDRFKSGVASEDEIKQYISLWNDTVAKRSEKTVAENRLKDLAKSYIDNERRKAEEEIAEEKKRFDEKESKRKKTLLIVIIIDAILILLAAGATYYTYSIGMNYLIPGAGVAAALFVLLVVLIILRGKKKTFVSKEIPEISEEQAIEIIDDDHKTRNLIKTIADDEALILSQIKNFLEKFGIAFDENKVTEELVSLLEDVNEYKADKDKLDKYNKNNEEYEKLEWEVDRFYESCGVKKEGDTAEQLDALMKSLINYEQFKEEAERKKQNVVQFESENDITKIVKELPEGLRELDEITDDISDAEEEIEESQEQLRSFRNRLEELQAERDRLEELSVRTDSEKETLIEYEKRYKIMSLTLEYLTKAKNELSKKYTGPTMEGFKKYCSFFDENNADDFKIDTSLNLTKVEAGMQREIRSLSLGLREATDFCLRLGLLDAMYQKEKPFLILDDPFVNFDASNLEAATKVLNKLQEEYQIIYLTCHESRAV